MRVGLSWDLDVHAGAAGVFATIEAEAAAAGRLGYDSAWIRERRDGQAVTSQPGLVLTYLARKVPGLQLRSIRDVAAANPVRLAEEVAVLDVFSRGRAGVAFAAASGQGEPTAKVHEAIELVRAAWALDELRYRGEHLRFPAHTGDDAPPGVSRPEARGSYSPQWEWGPATPDFLTITPKPYAGSPPVYAEIDDDDTLEWAAANGVSPFVGAGVDADEAAARLGRYRKEAQACGRCTSEVEVVLERTITAGAADDGGGLGGEPEVVATAIRDLAARTGLNHLVWRRTGADDADLFRFAVDVYPLLQA